MKSPPSRAHQTMLAFDWIYNIAGGDPSGGPRVAPGGPRVKAFSISFSSPLGAAAGAKRAATPSCRSTRNSVKVHLTAPVPVTPGFAFERPVTRMSPGAIDIDLAEHGKCHIIRARTKSRDIGSERRPDYTESIEPQSLGQKICDKAPQALRAAA
jgi:hypothetical protein